jgi:murein DD-endopeptidase MepM/ murein hydrolase activator NlpD
MLTGCGSIGTAVLPTPDEPMTSSALPPTTTVITALTSTVIPTIGIDTSTAVPTQRQITNVATLTPTIATQETETPTIQLTAVMTPSTEEVDVEVNATLETVTGGEQATTVPIQSSVEQLQLEATVKPETVHRYVFPVQNAKVTYGASHHDYPASDIFCPEGSDFVAVIDGMVDFISYTDTWSAKTNDPALRGGISIAIIGVDGNRYYGSHLTSISDGLVVGGQVKAGDFLGKTGKSGNARGTPPHLHFGISRPTTPDDWRVRRGEMNPFVFLNAWRKGEALEPEFGVK